MSSKKYFIYVEDDEKLQTVNLKMFNIYLKRMKKNNPELDNLEIVSLSGGFDCIDFIKKNPRDIKLIVSDYKMNEGSGLDVAKFLHSNNYSDIQLYILTGFSKEDLGINENNTESFDRVNYFYKKPLDIESFMKDIEKNYL